MAAKIEFGKTPSDELPVSLTLESAEIGMLDELYMTERLLGLFVDDVDNWDIWLEGADYDYTLRYFKDKSLQNCCVRIWEGLSDEELARVTGKVQARLAELVETWTIQEQCKLVDEVMDSIRREEKSWREAIQVGDLIDSEKNGFWKNGEVHRRKGQLYRVDWLSTQHEPWVYAHCYGSPSSEHPDNSLAEFAQSSSTVIVRNDKVIWESSGHMFGRYVLEHENRFKQHLPDWRWEEIVDRVLKLDGIEFPTVYDPFV